MLLRSGLAAAALTIGATCAMAEDKKVPCADVIALSGTLTPILTSMNEFVGWCRAQGMVDEGCRQFVQIIANNKASDEAAMLSVRLSALALSCPLKS